MFSNSRNVLFTGQPSFNNYESNFSLSTGAESLDEVGITSSITDIALQGIRLLLPRVVTGAMHNSGERFNAPSCHPETRIAIQEDVLGWVDELAVSNDLNNLVTWLYGPAGAGKSAIAQTIAQKLHARGQLTASFFFSRARGCEDRGSEINFIATLAHQLSQSLPTTRSHIAAAVRDNPLIFDLALQDQVDALIVAPLNAVSVSVSVTGKPRVIVVDGLDECRKEHNAQRRVVDALILGLRQIPNYTHKLFIASRPEYNIRAIFNDYGDKIVRKLELNDRWNPDDDIRTFLNASFAQIRRSHFYFENYPTIKQWPTSADVNELIRRSSGQFVYASVVMKYVQPEEHFNPAARLQVILDLKNNEDEPYAELDALYEYLFSQVSADGAKKCLMVICLERMHSEHKFKMPLPVLLSDFMDTNVNEIKFWLRPFASALLWEMDGIRYLHASLSDFLSDHSRSKMFSIYSASISTAIIRQASHILRNEATLTNHNLLPILFMLPRYFALKLPKNHKIHLHAAVLDFNVVDNVLRRISVDYIKYETVRSIAEFLEWILTEADTDEPLDANAALVELLAQTQAWFMDTLVYQGISAPYDEGDSLDLWPFVTVFPGDSIFFTTGLQQEIFRLISAALEICVPSTPFTTQFVQQKGNTISRLSTQTEFLCCLMPYLTQWRGRSDLLGRCALTPQRYAVAFLRTCHYLLRLPRDTLARLITVDRLVGFAPITQSAFMRFERKAFSHLARLLSPDIDLYFFVLYLSSVISDHGVSASRGTSWNNVQAIWSSERYSEMDKKSARPEQWGVPIWTMATSANYYLKMTRNSFPVLNDPTSPDYSRAATKATSSWVAIGNYKGPPLPIK